MTAWQPPKRKGRRTTIVAVVAATVLAAMAAVGAFVVVQRTAGDDGGADSPGTSDEVDAPLGEAEALVARLAAGLEGGSLTGVPLAVPVVGGVDAALADLTSPLGSFTLTVDPGPVTTLGPVQATAALQLEFVFPGEHVWATEGEVLLEQTAGEWAVHWDPAIIESSLRSGDRLSREVLGVGRAPILARDGTVLVGDVALVVIGIEPGRVQDLPSLVDQVAALIPGVDAVDLTARVSGAAPDAFVEVATLPRADYDLIREQIFPLPGTVFRERNTSQAIDETFARALIGRSGEVTAEILEQFPGLFRQGDVAGLSGLQALYNPQLTGSPGMEITVTRTRPDPSTTTTGTGLTTTSSVLIGPVVDTLFTVPAVEGQPLLTTLDPTLQRAAENALEATPLPSALVAIQVSTGDVLAMANGPTGSTVNFAATGQYPPGSIFKVVSSYALLTLGLDQGDPVDCPATVSVNGRSFANAEDEVFGVIPFRTAFAHSCNTAFVGATINFADTTLSEAGAAFGLGDEYDIGTPAFTGSVPVADGPVDLAAASFGQGRVLVSPLAAAVMAATAADGTYRSPRLVTGPEAPAQSVVPLEPGPAAELRELMRSVVTEGTGRAVAGADGGPVSGKTGTAEFGDEVPPRSHAWFVSFQGDVAVAVFVEGGEFGGSTAAPITRVFLDAIAG